MMTPGEWEPRHPLRASLVASSQERRQPSATGRADATGFAPILVHAAPSSPGRPFWMRASFAVGLLLAGMFLVMWEAGSAAR